MRTNAAVKGYYERMMVRNGKGQAMLAAAHKLAIMVYYVLYRNKPFRPSKSVVRKPGKPVLCLGPKVEDRH